MMKRKYYCLGLILMFIVSIAGCGGNSGGAPGSSGGENTGILIKSVSIVSDKATPDFDVAVHVCDPGPPPTYEPGITREGGVITIEASALNPDPLFDPFPASVEECTITFRKANEDPSSPILQSLTIYPNCSIIDGSSDCAVTIIDLQRKFDYWNALSGGINLPAEYPTHYIASFDCKYMGNYGKSGHFQVELDIWLADFDLC